MNIIIRQENANDFPYIKEVNDRAFNQPNEGILVEKLRLNKAFISELSLIAELDAKIIGHILFFPVMIKNNNQTFFSLALAPMSVLPEFQKKGIGKELVFSGLKTAAKIGHHSVIVLGHKDYYPKFGFRPASNWQIQAPFEVPGECFMALELIPIRYLYQSNKLYCNRYSYRHYTKSL